MENNTWYDPDGNPVNLDELPEEFFEDLCFEVAYIDTGKIIARYETDLTEEQIKELHNYGK